MEVDGFRPDQVDWVRLGPDRGWYRVVPGTFELKIEREWGAVHGSFGYGFSFCVDPGKGEDGGGYRVYGPVSSLTAVAVKR